MEEAEVCVFAVSMDSSMGSVFPDPIAMDDDEFTEFDGYNEEMNNNEKENGRTYVPDNSTGWAVSASIMEAIVASFLQFYVDFKIIKYFSGTTNVFHGNTNSLQSSTLNNVRQLAKNLETAGGANVELAVEEIKKALIQKRYLRKHVHWFMDAASFAQSKWDQYKPFTVDSELHVYIIGNICQLYDYSESVKAIRTEFSKITNSDLHFLFDMNDVMETNNLWLNKIEKVENVVMSVDLFIASQLCSIKIKGYELNGKPWQVKSMEVIGFLESATMSNTFEETWKVHETDTFHVHADQDKSRPKSSSNTDLLWYLATFLSESKPGLVCLCECSVMKSNSKTKFELCLLVPVACDTDMEIGLMVVRLRKKDYNNWKKILELELVKSILEKPAPIESKMYKKIANCEKKSIKKRLDEIQKMEKDEAEKEIELMRSEYKLVGVLNEFNSFLEEWSGRHVSSTESLEC